MQLGPRSYRTDATRTSTITIYIYPTSLRIIVVHLTISYIYQWSYTITTCNATATQVSDFACEWFDLPIEVIDDPLYDDDFDDTAPGANIVSTAERLNERPRLCSESLKVEDPLGLSEKGRQMLIGWVDHINSTGNEFVVMTFNKVCSDSLKLITGTDDRLTASAFLHKVVTKVTEDGMTTTLPVKMIFIIQYISDWSHI